MAEKPTVIPRLPYSEPGMLTSRIAIAICQIPVKLLKLSPNNRYHNSFFLASLGKDGDKITNAFLYLYEATGRFVKVV